MAFELSVSPKLSMLLTQISIFNPEFAKAPSWGSKVLASYTSVTTLPSTFLTWIEGNTKLATYIPSSNEQIKWCIRTLLIRSFCTYLILYRWRLQVVHVKLWRKECR